MIWPSLAQSPAFFNTTFDPNRLVIPVASRNGALSAGIEPQQMEGGLQRGKRRQYGNSESAARDAQALQELDLVLGQSVYEGHRQHPGQTGPDLHLF